MRNTKTNKSAREIRSCYLACLILVLASGYATAQENASNPLAAVNNADLRFQYFDLGGESDRTDLWMDAAHMLTPKHELHY